MSDEERALTLEVAECMLGHYKVQSCDLICAVVHVRVLSCVGRHLNRCCRNMNPCSRRPWRLNRTEGRELVGRFAVTIVPRAAPGQGVIQ